VPARFVSGTLSIDKKQLRRWRRSCFRDDGFFSDSGEDDCGWSGHFWSAAAGAVDAGGGAPLGEDFWGLAEAVTDGGVEAADEVAGLADEGGGACSATDVFDLVVRLFGSFVADGNEVVLQVGYEIRRQGVGDKFGHGVGVCEVRKEGGGSGEDLAVGVSAESEFHGKAGFLFTNGAGGGGNDLEVIPYFGEEVIFRTGSWAGRVSGVRVSWTDFSGEHDAASEFGGGDAAFDKSGSVIGSEAVDAFQTLIDGVVFVVHDGFLIKASSFIAGGDW
jgi:hypothetical protein